MSWKDFLYFQKGSRIAVILLLILIVLTLILNVLLSKRGASEFVLSQNDSIVREFEEFCRVLEQKDSVQSLDTLQSNNRWRMNTRNTKKYTKAPGIENTLPRTEVYFPSEKLSEGETIFLNETDTSLWKKIPGIGSVYANRIVKYRNLLGGFASIEQLREVYGIDDVLYSRIEPYITPDNNFDRIKVNHFSFEEMSRHPYLNYKQVKAIMSLRRRKGDISSIRELALLDEFTTEDILRLEPYLEF